MSELRIAGFAIAVLLSACAQPPLKTPPSETPVAAQASPAGQSPSSPAANPSRVGTVGLIRELKDRGMTSQNWAGVIGSVFTNDTEKDIIRVRYEVTIFYKDGSQGVLVLDQRPGVQAGQRVRVTGSEIEPLER